MSFVAAVIEQSRQTGIRTVECILNKLSSVGKRSRYTPEQLKSKLSPWLAEWIARLDSQPLSAAANRALALAFSDDHRPLN